MFTSKSNLEFLGAFVKVSESTIDEHAKRSLSVYMMNTNANQFAYDALIEKLMEPMVDFALSRVTKKTYEDSPVHLVKRARETFRKLTANKGELGEVLLYCFLESHLKAPKILTKYELKTSPNMHANGSDGIHYLKLENGNYQLIFCESKMYEAIGSAIEDAFESIRLFKEEVTEESEYKPGIVFEKSLLSNHLEKETFSQEDARFLKRLVYPTKNDEEELVVVDDAFAVFIGYEMKISDKDKEKPNHVFREELKERINKYVSKKIDKINNAIRANGLIGHDIYIYVVPFTDLTKSRQKILEGIIK